jgi:thiamine biosynthesis lipoprotein
MPEGSFRAMGGVVEVQLVNRGESDVDLVASVFNEYEQLMSRFLPFSELCALNRAAGAPFVASVTLFDIVAQAIDWARLTGGVFDPTVLEALESYGYDRTFDEIRGTSVRTHAITTHPSPWTAIRLDPGTRTITVPIGARIDLGGIGKGYTVDHAITALGHGANAMVNASGDLYAAGDGPDGKGWIIGVQDPSAPERDLAVLCVRDRGVATSGSTGRTWLDAVNRRYHHLIDARDRRCSNSDLLTVTVVASSATEADVLAKTAFLLGSDEGLATVEHFGAAALALTRDGSMLCTGTLKDYAL